MKKLSIACVVVALAALLFPTSVEANGGSKNQPQIKLTNNGSNTLAVIIDNANPPTDPNAFRAAGGKLLNPGESATFKVKVGVRVISAAFVNAAGDIGAKTTKNVNLNQGGSATFTVNGSYPNAPVIQ